MASAPAPLAGWPADDAGARLALQRALEAAGCEPVNVDLIYAAANGGQTLDRIEGKALMKVFGRGDGGPVVTAIKGALGESFAGGAVRTAAAALSLAEGKIAPTLGLEEPELILKHARRPIRDASIGRVVVNAMAPGGTFVALVLKGDGGVAKEGP
jgi:3-oxoacyl-(acyl-carrier-protein) synthase